MTKIKRLVEGLAQEIRPDVRHAFAALWSVPERPLEEVHASSTLVAWLRGEGFEVEHPVAGIPTAFRASWGEGGPVIAFLAEYDALPGLGNEAIPARSRKSGGVGHGCGHAHIGPANCGAAVVVRKALEAMKLGGRVVVIGCPAEEILWGKVALADRGAFEGVDLILTSHGDYQNAVVNRPCQSARHGEIVFRGRASHTGAARGGNALDALELTVQGLERFRSHGLPGVLVEHVIRRGGEMPNIVPEESRLWVFFRAASHDEVERAYQVAEQMARDAARLTRTTVSSHLISACRGYFPNKVVADTLWESYGSWGAPPWQESDVSWMRQLSAEASPGEPFVLESGIQYLDQGMDPYAQDDGDISWRIPLGRVNWAMPQGVPLHHWATTALTGSEAGAVGPLHCLEVLAGAGLRFFQSPELVRAAQEELERARGKALIPAPEYCRNPEFWENPSEFWSGSWTG
jgi:aminobenzoyl-glutamate utilization protein B